ncbi:MAG TPA: FAD-dependent oxidoreductase [Thermoplasmata archaeon]|nr:FAD-dependent oxidoreductase [Thermoplasmata archaeon]
MSAPSPTPFAPHIVRFLGATPETREVSTFRFAPEKGDFEWRPGQFLEMVLPEVQDPRGSTRLFTISSSPTEKGSLTITTRSGPSPFKTRLHQLRAGDTVEIRAPDGDFVLEPGRPALMLAGGIGVTPFRSMLRYAADVGLGTPCVLVYSSRTPEDIVFRRELDELARRNRALKIVHTITRPAESKEPWTGATGRIVSALLRKAMENVHAPIVYIAGPPGLVREHRQVVVDEFHLPESDVRSDEFDGY